MKTYLPQVSNGPTEARPPVEGQTSGAFASELFKLMSDDKGQKRAVLTPNDLLAKVAQARVLDMLKRDYFSHTDPDGNTPNWHVRQAGYKLPDWYPDGANNVESIGLNYQTPQATWDGWLDSEAHRVHVLGLLPFFAEQTQIGVAFAVGDEPYPCYWALISAPPQEDKP